LPFFIAKNTKLLLFTVWEPLAVTIRGDIQNFASQKSPLISESYSHGMRSSAHS